MNVSCHNCEFIMYWRECGIHAAFFDCSKLEDDWHKLIATEFSERWPIGYEGLPTDGKYAEKCPYYKEFPYMTSIFGDPRYIEPILPTKEIFHEGEVG